MFHAGNNFRALHHPRGDCRDQEERSSPNHGPIASAFFVIDASTGKLTSPVAATFPAVVAEIERNCLREEFV